MSLNESPVAGNGGHLDDHALAAKKLNADIDVAVEYGTNSAAINAAIAAVLGGADPATSTRTASRALYLGPHDFTIDAPVVIESALGLRIEGAGRELTRLHPVGALAQVLELNGLSRCQIGGFSIEGNRTETVDTVIRLHHAGVSRTSNFNRLHDIIINTGTRFVCGVELGAPGENTQVDSTMLDNVAVLGGWQPGEATYWQHGVHVGSGSFSNNLDHKAYNLTVASCRRGLYIDRSQIAVFGFHAGRGEDDIYVNGVTSYLHVAGCRSESSQRLINMPGANSYPSDINLESIDWKANKIAMDGRWCIFRNGGTVRMGNVRCFGSNTFAPVIYSHTDPGRGQTLIVDGLASKSLLVDSFDLGAEVGLRGRGFTTINDAGQAAAQVHDFSEADLTIT